MTTKRVLKWGSAAVAALALVATLGSYDANAGTFNPKLEITVDDPAPEATSDISVAFSIPDGDVMFAGAVTFYPNDWGIVKGSEIPVGTRVGTVNADATLGLINSSCDQALPVEFEMYNASLNNKDTVAFYDDTDGNNTDDFADDKDKNGLWDAIDKYPDFMDRIFYEDKNNNGVKDEGEPPIVPFRRSAGVSIVASTPVLLQFVIFPPGTKVSNRVDLPNDKELGFPSVTVLQAIGDPDAVPKPGSITDFCSPLTSTISIQGKTDDGQPLFYNPQNGTYKFNAISAGQRDGDGDGFENGLDTCPYVKNVGNPRIRNEGDADSDGLDAACDPNDNPDTGGTNSDQDGDGYLNAQDNCPLVANGETDATNQVDDDLDQIGDACDKDPTVADGELILQQPVQEIKIGDGTGARGPSTACGDKCASPDAPATTSDSGGSDGGGGGGSSAIIIVIAIIAAVVVLGGGAFLFMRKRA